MRERLLFGAMDPDEKPELLHKERETVFLNHSLDQFRRALKRNFL